MFDADESEYVDSLSSAGCTSVRNSSCGFWYVVVPVVSRERRVAESTDASRRRERLELRG